MHLVRACAQIFLGSALALSAGAAPPRALVFLRDAAPAPAGEDRAGMIRRKRAALAAGRAHLETRLSPAARFVRGSWAAGAWTLELGPGDRARLAGDPAIRRVLDDGAVTAPETTRVRMSRDAAAPPEYTWGLETLGVPAIREQFGLTGAGVTIGHIDSGVAGTHPDLSGKVAAWRDFSAAAAAEPTDESGHGTHTAATLVGGDASGTQIGVAPGARLVTAAAFVSDSTLLAAMEWMLDPDGVPETDDGPRVVSMSWRSLGEEQNPFYEMLATYEAAGVLPIFSAGNGGRRGPRSITTPKEHPYAFVVGATTQADRRAAFSSIGPADFLGGETQKPDLVAPGNAVFSATPGGGWGAKNGTSMAAPHVAGLAALLLEADPGLSAPALRAILVEATRDLDAEGWDPETGHGRIQGYEAVAAVIQGRAPAAPATSRFARQVMARLDGFQQLHLD